MAKARHYDEHSGRQQLPETELDVLKGIRYSLNLFVWSSYVLLALAILWTNFSALVSTIL